MSKECMPGGNVALTARNCTTKLLRNWVRRKRFRKEKRKVASVLVLMYDLKNADFAFL